MMLLQTTLLQMTIKNHMRVATSVQLLLENVVTLAKHAFLRFQSSTIESAKVSHISEHYQAP